MIADTNTGADAVATFADLDAYIGLPRVAGLRLSPDGRRLVVGVATPNRKGNRFVSALWEVDPGGERPARRLTRSSDGESVGAFTPSGDLLFASKRPEPDGDDDATAETSLWALPAGGGDARLLARLPGGAQGIVVARDGGQVVLAS
ncbi:MAG TPA: S9 family peptidase, partial [Pseudonocardiaceae bacterium]